MLHPHAGSRTLTVIRVFVSSPGDMAEERAMVGGVIAKHNEMFGTPGGYVLEGELFEERVAPAAGRPQQVIDDEMGKAGQHDIVIGILGSTLGTVDETGRTGTQQELDSALRAFRAAGRPEIMVYRRQHPDDANVGPVADYVRTLGANLLIAKYSTAVEFRELLEKHLAKKSSDYIQPLLLGKGERDASRILRMRMSQYWLDEGTALRDLNAPAAVPMRFSEGGQVVIHSTSSFKTISDEAMQGLPRVAVIGGRGSGKTFALLSLIKQAMQPGRRVPVYLAATDWLPRAGAGERSVEAWLLDELHDTYKLKKRGKGSARELINDRRILPFIDGLDELLTADEEDGERKFEAFRSALRLWAREEPVVVACESRVWAERCSLLASTFATVNMLPFENTSQSLADRPELKQTVDGNPVLQELCKVPLAVMLLRRLNAESPGMGRRLKSIASVAEGLRVLLENAFESRSIADLRFDKRTRHEALGRIARLLQPSGSFEIEYLQPGSFGLERPYRLFAGFGLALFIFLTVVPPSFASLAIERVLAGQATVPHELSHSFSSNLVSEALVSATLAGGLAAVFVFAGMLLARGWLGFAVTIGVAFGCARGVVLGLGLTDDLSAVAGPAHGLRIAAITSALFVLVMMVIFRNQRFSPVRIRPFEVRVGDVRRQVGKAAQWALPSGLIVAAVFGALWGLARAVSFGLMVAVALETILIVSARPVPRTVRPNDGILVSLETSLKIGAAALIAGPLCFGLGYWTISRESAIVNAILGLNVSLIVLMCGALPVVQHYALRLALARKRILPLALVEFCEECVHLGMLNRAGNRYQFSHDYIRLYFAGETPTEL